MRTNLEPPILLIRRAKRGIFRRRLIYVVHREKIALDAPESPRTQKKQADRKKRKWIPQAQAIKRVYLSLQPSPAMLNLRQEVLQALQHEAAC